MLQAPGNSGKEKTPFNRKKTLVQPGSGSGGHLPWPLEEEEEPEINF